MYDDFMESYYESGEAIANLVHIIDMYQEKSAVERFFESDDAGSKVTEASVGSAFKRALEAVKKMISNLMETISTWISHMFDKNEQARMKAFKEKIANDPEFAGKKVTIKNFREIEKREKEAIKTVDDYLAKMDRARADQVSQIEQTCIDSVNRILGGAKTAAEVTVSKDVLLRIAESNKNAAKIIQKMLNDENSIMKNLESSLGDSRAQDFRKKIDSCTKKLSLHRLKLRLLGQWHKGLVSSTKQIYSDFGDIAGGKVLTHLGMVDDALGAFNNATGTNIRKRDLYKTKRTVDKKIDGFKKDINRMRNDAERSVNKAKRTVNTKRNSAKDNIEELRKWIQQ